MLECTDIAGRSSARGANKAGVGKVVF